MKGDLKMTTTIVKEKTQLNREVEQDKRHSTYLKDKVLFQRLFYVRPVLMGYIYLDQVGGIS